MSCWVSVSVHPHGRGEHAAPKYQDARSSGSSPRSWGTPRAMLVAVCIVRFIPTVVGNTILDCASWMLSAVHPHGRGEHSSSVSGGICIAGSSPRSWGTLNNGHGSDILPRFIPTVVGNTFIGFSVISVPSVHPHGRGEHIYYVAGCVLLTGSSPRSWGKQPTTKPPITRRRFIPTVVGNTTNQPSSTPLVTVHPHGRGEH